MRAAFLITGILAVTVLANPSCAAPRSDARCWEPAQRAEGGHREGFAYRDAFDACVSGGTIQERWVVVIEEVAGPWIAIEPASGRPATFQTQAR